MECKHLMLRRVEIIPNDPNYQCLDCETLFEVPKEMKIEIRMGVPQDSQKEGA